MTTKNHPDPSARPRSIAARAALLLLALTAGCASLPDGLPASGPSTVTIEEATLAASSSGIQLVEITDRVARSIQSRRQSGGFTEAIVDGEAHSHRVGPGDTLEIAVWEAPPAMLFGASATDPRLLGGTAVVTHLPPQVVDGDGSINVPFAGRVRAGGNTPREIEGRIGALLRDKTNQIQVMVRISQNASANVTVVGEVRNSSRVPLSPKSERLLDVLAAAGGVTQPVGKMTLQLTRGDKVRALPLDTVVRDPRQNIVMQPGDIVTAVHQPYSYAMLGAAGKNEEVNFEANGISLTQALARSGGLNDNRADRHGVFVFRYEDPKSLDWQGPVTQTADGKVPVVYRLDLGSPASFLIAQNFQIEDKDVLYISNAPAAELQKFLNIVTSIAAPIFGFVNLTR